MIDKRRNEQYGLFKADIRLTKGYLRSTTHTDPEKALDDLHTKITDFKADHPRKRLYEVVLRGGVSTYDVYTADVFSHKMEVITMRAPGIQGATLDAVRHLIPDLLHKLKTGAWPNEPTN